MLSGVKICTRCGKAKVASEFYPHPNTRDKLHSRCKPCVAEASREWRKDNPELYQARLAKHRKRAAVYKARQRSAPTMSERDIPIERLERRYGLEPGAYTQMMTAQNSVCLICGRPFGVKSWRPVVDHDHTTGAVRGILHARCNTALGAFEDNPQLLDAARFYLKWYGGKR